MRCAGCNANLTEGTAICPSCGKEVEDRYLGFSMGWYKFLIYFGLWVSALMGAANGVTVMTGTTFGASRDSIYQMYPQLEPVCVAVGTLLLGLAILAAVAALALKGLRKSGPVLLLCCYGGSILSTLLQLFLMSWATEGLLTPIDLVDGRVAVSLLADLLFFIINLIYFKKRAVLFR